MNENDGLALSVPCYLHPVSSRCFCLIQGIVSTAYQLVQTGISIPHRHPYTGGDVNALVMMHALRGLDLFAHALGHLES
jgi:hypothetical protein